MHVLTPSFKYLLCSACSACFPTNIRATFQSLLLVIIGTATLSTSAHALAIEEATIADIQAAYREGRMSVQQVVEAHLARIDAYDKHGPLINSLITINPKAIEEAKAMDAKLAAGKGKISGALFGIPVIVKDNLDAVGMPMTSGFQGWKNYYPPTDAPVVAKIKAAGGIIIAKASLSEFARGGGDNINSVLCGFARNPYNTAFATGGSSGGTGASLAANVVLIVRPIPGPRSSNSLTIRRICRAENRGCRPAAP